MCAKHTKICHFYAEIVKFGLISTHLKLIWGETGEGEKYFGGICPHAHLWHCHCRVELQVDARNLTFENFDM